MALTSFQTDATGRIWQRVLPLLLLTACASKPPAAERGSGFAAGSMAAETPAIITAMPTCAADNMFCESPGMTATTPMGPGTASTGPTNCGSVPLELQPAGVNVMIAVDGSASMAMRWSSVETAIRSLRKNNTTAAFGMQLFWADAIDVWSGQTNMNTSNNSCSAVHSHLLEPSARSADELITFLGTGPKGGMITGRYEVSPVLDALSDFLANAPKLLDPQKTNYLLLVTTGNDNCFGAGFVSRDDKLTAYEKLAIELNKLNIRTIPIGVDAPSSSDPNMGRFTGMSGGMGMPLATDYEVLETLLKYGGSALKQVPRIDTPAKLTELVSEVGQAVANCRFEIPDTLDSRAALNPFELSFSINKKPVPRDRHQANGWDFVSGSTKQVEFFGQACQALQAGQAVQANKTCEQNICGTAAVSVETKPREVLLLLDSSASRIECTDGSLDCLSLPGTAGRPLTYWETVEHAVASALVAPVNDDVRFGLQFFPNKTAEALSCEVAAQPEIAPAPSEQIAIMKSMLEKLPFGLSPVVGVMESVAAAPGTLADPGVVGAVVLLSDGGDNCSGAMQPEIVSRLGAAAKKLLTAGVRTYAIRYGSAESETAAQAEQLTAVVTQGGTALSGKTAYIDAKSEKELNDALAAISDRIASCTFALGGLQTKVDKSRANLFLNGESIGFDAKATKEEGWNWVDADRTAVELYGQACTAFKTNRQTRVVVEFGCEPVVIKGPD